MHLEWLAVGAGCAVCWVSASVGYWYSFTWGDRSFPWSRLSGFDDGYGMSLSCALCRSGKIQLAFGCDAALHPCLHLKQAIRFLRDCKNWKKWNDNGYFIIQSYRRSINYQNRLRLSWLSPAGSDRLTRYCERSIIAGENFEAHSLTCCALGLVRSGRKE